MVVIAIVFICLMYYYCILKTCLHKKRILLPRLHKEVKLIYP